MSKLVVEFRGKRTLRQQGPECQQLFVMRRMKERGKLIHGGVRSPTVPKRVLDLLFQIGQHGVCVRWAI